MNWRFVLQPDGLLARFCEEEHDFTDFALSEKDAYAECMRIGMQADVARRIVREALDERCHESGLPLGKLGRWNECLWEIRLEKGAGGLEFALSEMGFPHYELPKGAPAEPQRAMAV